MQAPGADVLEVPVHLGRGPRDLPEAVVREDELDAVRREERGGLLRERVLGLGEDAQEVLVA